MDEIERSAVEVVRALFEAYRDGRTRDAVALLHPDVVIEPSTRPARSVYRGFDGARQMMQDLGPAVTPTGTEFEDYVELPDGRVEARGHVVLMTEDGPIKGPRVAPIVTVRDGLVARLESWGPEPA